MRYSVILLYLLSFTACASSPDCQNLSTQIEMTNCASNKLDKIEKKIKEKIIYLSGILLDKKELLLANKYWESYRDSHCLSVSNIYEGGSLHNYILIECKINLSKIRLQSLESDYKDSIEIIKKGAP